MGLKYIKIIDNKYIKIRNRNKDFETVFCKMESVYRIDYNIEVSIYGTRYIIVIHSKDGHPITVNYDSDYDISKHDYNLLHKIVFLPCLENPII
jgi:hypothetical protein